MKDRVIIENVVEAGEEYLVKLVLSLRVARRIEGLDEARTELLDAVEKLVQAGQR